MPAAVDSAFELAFWFCDRALNDGEYLQPIKMHYLMYLSQAGVFDYLFVFDLICLFRLSCLIRF